MWGEAEGFSFYVFVLECFNHLWVRSSGVEQKSYLRPAEIASFCFWFYSRMEDVG